MGKERGGWGKREKEGGCMRGKGEKREVVREREGGTETETEPRVANIETSG